MREQIRSQQLLLASVASGLVALVGCVVLLGWLADIDTMKSLLPGFATMKANTALCAIALGVGLFKAVGNERRAESAGRADLGLLLLAAPSLLIALLTLGEYLWSLDFGIDALIGSPAASDSAEQLPMRMASVAAVAIALGAGALLLLALPATRRQSMPQLLATALGVLMLTTTYGHLYAVEALYRTDELSAIALHSSIVFLAFALGLLAVTADRGWIADFSQPTPSSAAARNTLLAVALAVPVIGSLRLAGQHAGWYDTGFGLAIMSVVLTVVVTVLLWHNSRRAGVADRELARLSRLYSQLSQTNQAIVRCPDEESLFPRVCQVAVEFGQFEFAWIAMLDAKAGVTRLVAQAGAAPGVLGDADGEQPQPRSAWPYAPTLLLNKYLFSNQSDADPAPTPWHRQAMRAGYHTAAIPIRRNDVVVGALNLYAREAEYFGAYAIPTLEEVALDISFALDNYGREAERAAALSALQASEQRFAELAVRLPVGLFSLAIDREGGYRYTYVSPQYCHLMGVTAERMMRDPNTPLKIAHPEDLAEYQRIRARSRLLHGPVALEMRYIVRGAVRWIRTLGQPHPEQDGEVAWSGVVMDITDQKQAEQERDRLRSQLTQAQKMEAIGQLTGGIAHDFNNILGSVLGFTTLALAREVPDPDSKLASYLNEVQRGAERARDLVAKMMKFSRVDKPGSVLDVLQPQAALEEVTKLLGAVLPASMAVVREYDEQLPALAVSSVAFHQAVMNLAINARDAMNGQGQLTLSVRLQHVGRSVCASCQRGFEGDYVVLRIADDGPGIAPESQTEIFRPFFTTKEVGKGTGLGLAMVHGIVHDAHGHILLESAPGSGTRFQLLFPPFGGPSPQAAPVALPVVGNAGGGACIAVVDDEPALTRLWQELLEGNGYRVLSFNDSTSALAAFQAQPEAFDAMVLDMTMPQLSGDSLARQILTRRPELPVFICTGYSDRLDTLMAQSLGVRGVFTKPVDFDEVLKHIGAALHSDPAASPAFTTDTPAP
ncbi:MAG: response regulator [Gammaproteobacteria bacterium]|nr:response regulator [Gammaproteobacteria bacterium]